MAKITRNLYEAKAPEAVPAGPYHIRISKIVDKPAKEAGKFPFHNLHLEIQDPAEFQGKLLFGLVSESPDSDWRTKQIFEACQAPFDETGFDVDELLGCEAIVVAEVTAPVIDEATGRIKTPARNQVTEWGPVQ